MSKLSDALRLIADEMENRDAQTLEAFHEKYIRPLQESRILRNSEVAARLQVSPAQITKLVDKGKIPTTADGRITEYHLWLYLTGNVKTASNLTNHSN